MLPASLTGQPLVRAPAVLPAAVVVTAVAVAPPPSAPSLPRFPVVPQPGGPLAPSPSSDQRNCVYFGVEDLEPPESSAAT